MRIARRRKDPGIREKYESMSIEIARRIGRLFVGANRKDPSRLSILTIIKPAEPIKTFDGLRRIVIDAVRRCAAKGCHLPHLHH